MRRFPIALLALLSAGAAIAQPLDLEAIARQPDTQVTRRQQDGAEVVEIRRAGVTITIDKDGERSVDRSGKAVWCYWEIAVAVKIAADLCYPGEFAALSRMLGEHLDAANDFIVANSLRPVKKADLERKIAERRLTAAAGIKAAGMPPALNRACQSRREEDLLPLNAELEKYRREFSDALAVPRPPAENPCL